jgi:Flp pilus assembly protein CpaB
VRIGVDLGGTKIEAIALAPDGGEVVRVRIPTPRSYAETIAAVADLVGRVEDEAGESGTVGVGMPGTISPLTGVVKNANSVWLIGKPFDRDLVAASAGGLFAAHAAVTAGPRDSYLVAGRDLEVGHRLEPGDLAAVALDLSDAVAAGAFTAADQVVGATVLARRATGELLQRTDLIRNRGEPGSREVSFAVDASRALADRIRVGERVAVVATYGTGADAFTTAVVSDARVLQIGSVASGLVSDGRLTLTLELSDSHDMLALAHAVDVAQITVVRTTGAADAPDRGPYRPAQAVSDAPGEDN